MSGSHVRTVDFLSEWSRQRGDRAHVYRPRRVVPRLPILRATDLAIGPLPITEVLDAVRSPLLEPNRMAPASLGTDLGDRLRDARTRCVRDRRNKKGHLLAF
jgi:hypothetical protein